MIPGNVRQVDRAELQCFNVTLNSMVSIARRHSTSPKARDFTTPHMVIVVKEVGSFFAFDKAPSGFGHKMMINIKLINFLTIPTFKAVRNRYGFGLIF